MRNPFSRNVVGTSALKDAAVSAMANITTQESEFEPVVMAIPELPKMDVASISLTYYTQEYPTQDQLKAMTDYLEVAYNLKCQYATVDNYGGKSWTDPNSRFMVTIRLHGKK
jgi:hypothetical protein